MYEKHGGLAKGVVIDTMDPSGYKRIRVRIPELHGAMSESVYPTTSTKNTRGNSASLNRIADEKIPWAEVCYPFGSDIPPELNQVVLVGFIGGDTDKPVVLGWLGYEYVAEEEAFVYRTRKNPG